MLRVVVIITCFNRAEKTIACVESLSNNNKMVNLEYVVVDDKSTDDTVRQLKKLRESIKIDILETEGNRYYSGGMRRGIDYVLSSPEYKTTNYIILANDDVAFFPNAIDKLLIQEDNQNKVIAGATCGMDGAQSYGAVVYPNKKRVKATKVEAGAINIKADTFNANCVLIPFDIVRDIGSFDKIYIHTLGDYDYGLSISSKGYRIETSKEYVGICDNNSRKGTWLDNSLPLIKRIRLKESIKGAPTRQWWHFVNKNFGTICAIKSVIKPYLKLLLENK